MYILWFVYYRIAQEQCCAAVLEDHTCTTGINMAKDQGSCDALLSSTTCETKTAKVCVYYKSKESQKSTKNNNNLHPFTMVLLWYIWANCGTVTININIVSLQELVLC